MSNLKKELSEIECKVALIFGNIGLLVFSGEKSGITHRSGETQYLPEYDMLACWCVHPSWVLRDRKERMEDLKKGIKNFLNTFDDIPF